MSKVRQHWAEQWIHYLKHHPHGLVLVLWLVCAPSVYLLVAHLVEHSYEQQLNVSVEQAQQNLDRRSHQAEHDLNMIMLRFKELPHFLATHELFVETLQHPISPERLVQANMKLHNIAHFLSVNLIMLIDRKGMCIASSNYDSAQSIVGTDLSDRRYVQSSLSGEAGHQYAVGRVTAIPGFYFSAPVFDTNSPRSEAIPLGILASKLNMEQVL